MNEAQITEALKAVKYPGYSRDIVSFGLVKDVAAGNGAVTVVIELTSHNPDAAAKIKTEAEAAIRALPDVKHAFVEVKMPPPSGKPAPAAGAGGLPQANKVPGINRVIAVASGKGGVGKSTCSVNLACALQALGAKVGLLDCDIYGPSVPLMMGVSGKPQVGVVDGVEKLLPPENYGVKLMSMGFLLDGDQPVIWRGPMIQKTIQQFITQVDWGQLDYLLVDLPPGTGDAQLSLCQTVPLDGGVIVTTPQEASLGVVRKGINMFHKVNVPILGLIENMSHYTLPNGDKAYIFGQGGGRLEAERQEIPFLGEVPIYQEIREGGDAGRPVVAADANSGPAKAFAKVAEALKARLG
ncbi:MAG TPA: chromosome partitioning protein [Verrucomicrobiales bacterium]|nr:chromosome partitioning protein [Verrucomicrobiales bacterium]